MGSRSEFETALSTAASNQDDDRILLKAGSIDFDSEIDYSMETRRSLLIEGGYDANCTTMTVTPTVFVRPNAAIGRLRLTTVAGDLTLRNLRFDGIVASNPTFAAVQMSAYSGTLRFDRITVRQGFANAAVPVVKLYSDGGLVLTNSLIVESRGGSAAVAVGVSHPSEDVLIANNTIANNHFNGVSMAGLALDIDSPYRPVWVVNNIVWGQIGIDGVDIDLGNGNLVFLRSNNFMTSAGSPVLTSASGSNTNLDPQFDPAYKPQVSFANSGMPLQQRLGDRDVLGQPRLIGSAPARGAVEPFLGDQAFVTVTSTADSGVGSLRATIDAANLSGNPAHIEFDLGPNCGPHVIALNSPLPPIAVPLVIDGFSQPGASPTASNFSFVYSATTCVILHGGNGSVQRAFSLAGAASDDVHVDIRGLAFSGFANAAVQWSKGAGHWLHGNTFGVATASTGPLFRNYNNIIINGSATASMIGGPTVADTNLIGNAGGIGFLQPAGVGVYIAGNAENTAVEYNFIGNAASTTVAAGNNGEGVRVSAPYGLIRRNLIRASGRDAILLDGALGTRVVDNRIGHGPTFPALINAGAGVHLINNADQNWIGGRDVQAPGTNQISVSGLAGVWVDSSAGAKNQVIGNNISYPANGGLSIDVDALGSTDNASLPPQRQPKPTIQSVKYVNQNTVRVQGQIEARGEALGGNVRLSLYAVMYGCADIEAFEAYLRSIDLMVDVSPRDFTVDLVLPQDLVDEGVAGISATASTVYQGISVTSEATACAEASNFGLLFADGFETLP